ncbi:hypothetical protein TSMEX_007594 [Taenia solium]|eukprot:TsM_001203000 transcript=TsM_001203000 gene=TsM_001203000
MRTLVQCVQSILVSFYRLTRHPHFSLCVVWLLLILLYFSCWLYLRDSTKWSGTTLPQSQERALLSSTSREMHLRRGELRTLA